MTSDFFSGSLVVNTFTSPSTPHPLFHLLVSPGGPHASLRTKPCCLEPSLCSLCQGEVMGLSCDCHVTVTLLSGGCSLSLPVGPCAGPCCHTPLQREVCNYPSVQTSLTLLTSHTHTCVRAHTHTHTHVRTHTHTLYDVFVLPAPSLNLLIA